MNSKVIISIFIFASFNLFSQISQNMIKLAQVDGLIGAEYNDVWGYTAPDGKEYAIIGSTKSVGIYDVTNCSNPIFKYEFIDGLTDNNYWRDFDIYQNVLFGIGDTGSEGLEVFNLTNMNNITVTQNTTQFIKAHTLFLDSANARLYIAGARDSNPNINNWIIIYDVSTPLSPVLLKKIRLNDIEGMQGTENLYMHDLYVKDNIAFVSQGYAGFYIWDCNNVDSIKYLGHLDDGSQYNHSSWQHPNFQGDSTYFYIAEEAPAGAPIKVFLTIDNGNDYSVILKKKFKNPLEAPTYTNPRPHNPYVKENGLYISYYMDGVQLYDVTNPENPYRVAYYDTYPNNNGLGYSMDQGFNGVWSVYPFLNSGCILAADMTYGLVTLKVKFPKVEINGNIHLPVPNSGIIFRDSSNTYRQISVDNSGNILNNLVSGLEYDYKTDSADIEIINFPNSIYLTSPNNKKYKIDINNNGILTSTQYNNPITNATSFNGNLLIDNKHRSLIMRSSATKRWKVGVKNNGSITTYRTSF